MNDQQRAAMQMALEALEGIGEQTFFHEGWSGINKLNAAITALREALAQPQGEWVEIVDGDVHEVMKHTNPARHPQLFARAVIAKFKEKNTPPVVPQGEPVARIVRYIGQDPYPGKGYTVARTYAELPENAYPDHWEEGAKLYTAPPSVEDAIEDKGDYMEGYEEGWKYGALDMKEKAANLRKEVPLCGRHSEDYEEGFWDALDLYEAAIRSMK